MLRVAMIGMVAGCEFSAGGGNGPIDSPPAGSSGGGGGGGGAGHIRTLDPTPANNGQTFPTMVFP